MNTSSFHLKISIILASYTIAIFAAIYSEWFWSAFFFVDFIEKVIRLKGEG